jgi:DNA-binding NarL/FixJ family response regulator
MILVIENNFLQNKQIISFLKSIFNKPIEGYHSIEESISMCTFTPEIIIMNSFFYSVHFQNAVSGEKGVLLLKSAYPKSRLIIFSEQDSLNDAIKLIESGADEYIFKTSNFINKIENKSLIELKQKILNYTN